RELWGFLRLDLLQRIVGVCAHHCIKGVVYPAEQCTASIQRNDGIVERRRRGLPRNRVPLLPLPAHALFDRRLIIQIPDLIEWWRLVGEGTRPGKGICLGERLRLGHSRWGR